MGLSLVFPERVGTTRFLVALRSLPSSRCSQTAIHAGRSVAGAATPLRSAGNSRFPASRTAVAAAMGKGWETRDPRAPIVAGSTRVVALWHDSRENCRGCWRGPIHNRTVSASSARGDSMGFGNVVPEISRPANSPSMRRSFARFLKTSHTRTIAEACQRVADRTGVIRKPTQIRQFLKNLGLKWQRVRAIVFPSDAQTVPTD